MRTCSIAYDNHPPIIRSGACGPGGVRAWRKRRSLGMADVCQMSGQPGQLGLPTCCRESLPKAFGTMFPAADPAGCGPCPRALDTFAVRPRPPGQSTVPRGRRSCPSRTRRSVSWRKSATSCGRRPSVSPGIRAGETNRFQFVADHQRRFVVKRLRQVLDGTARSSKRATPGWAAQPDRLRGDFRHNIKSMDAQRVRRVQDSGRGLSPFALACVPAR